MTDYLTHTPGPWRFDGDWQRIPAIFGPDDRQMIATVEKHKHLNGGFGMQEDLPEREGNARLLAAAPDMLKALLSIAYGTTDEMPPFRAMPREEMQRIARDAIRIIEGASAHRQEPP